MTATAPSLRYGDRIQHRRDRTEYFVRAIAPGVCAVIAPVLVPLADIATEAQLRVLPAAMFPNYEVVPA